MMVMMDKKHAALTNVIMATKNQHTRKTQPGNDPSSSLSLETDVAINLRKPDSDLNNLNLCIHSHHFEIGSHHTHLMRSCTDHLSNPKKRTHHKI